MLEPSPPQRRRTGRAGLAVLVVAAMVGAAAFIVDDDGSPAELTVRSRRTDPPGVTTSTLGTTTTLPAPSTSSTTLPGPSSTTTTRRPVTSTTSATSPSTTTSAPTVTTKPTSPGGLSNRATDNRLVPLADGAAYNPATDEWRLLSPAPLDPRLFHTAVWTGQEMIIWGGTANSEDGSPQPAPQGAAYNPRTDTWRVLPESPLSSRGFHSAVWTGTEMIVAGGSAGVRTPWVGDTAAYNPTTDRWETLPSTGAHREEAGQAVWTGRQVIIYSGSYGYSYDPAARRWTTLPALTTSRSGHRLVWTGTDVLIFGGWLSGTTWYNDGGIYRPGP